MTATTEAPTIHRNLGELIELGKPGDVCHDLPSGTDRSVETFVMVSRRVVGPGEGLAHPEGSIVGTFNEVRTTHHGRAELWGRPEYTYRSIATDAVEASTEPGGMFVRRVFSVGHKQFLAAPDTPAKRYGRAKLIALHRTALEREGITTEGLDG